MTGSGTIIGTDANDVIVGPDGADTINGRAGTISFVPSAGTTPSPAVVSGVSHGPR
jgi:hypothetical protein